MILRDRHIADPWTAEASNKRTERRYYCQNWRADVSAILTDEGSMVEWVKYSAYGVPFGLPAGDTDSDGDWDGDDKGRIGSGAYDVRKDVNLDGVEDSDDVDQGNAVTGGNHTLGRGVLSAGGPGGAVGNRRGYAGYEYAPELEGTGAAVRHLYHVRHRVYDADVGRWTRRDPLGYVDGMGLYEYVRGLAVFGKDPSGLSTQSCAANSCIMYPPDSERWPGGRGPGIGPRVPGSCPEPLPESPYQPKPPPPLPIPILPACLAMHNTPNVVAAMTRLRAECPQVQINMHCGKCSGESGLAWPSYFTPCSVEICINLDGPRVTGVESTILHEIEHARQMCSTYGLCSDGWRDTGAHVWDDPDNIICQELGANCAEPRNSPYCLFGIPVVIGTLCDQACNSIEGEQAGTPTKAWLKCKNRCLEIAPFCKNGLLYIPPRDWY